MNGYELGKEKVYIRNIRSYSYLAIFALATKALRNAGADFGVPAFSEFLLAQWNDWYPTLCKAWRDLTKALINHTVSIFKKESAKYSKVEGEDLTYANYFKNQSYMSGLLDAPLSKEAKAAAAKVLKA